MAFASSYSRWKSSSEIATPIDGLTRRQVFGLSRSSVSGSAR